MAWLSGLGLFLCLLVLAFAGLRALGAKRWANTTRALAGRLDAARLNDQAQPERLARSGGHLLQRRGA